MYEQRGSHIQVTKGQTRMRQKQPVAIRIPKAIFSLMFGLSECTAAAEITKI